MVLFNQGYFSIECYTNKTYFLISFILIALMGLISFYALLFAHINNYDISYVYLMGGLTVMWLLIKIKVYTDRKINFPQPWKDEW